MIGIRTGELTQIIVDKYGGSDAAKNTAKYIPLTQVASSTGGANNIADVLVLGAWKSSGNFLDGFEVKISRGDWLNEVKNPEKCTAIKQYCDRWWLVIADESMVKDGELPSDWGMMVCTEGKTLKVVKKAPFLSPKPLSNDFVASLLRTDARGSVPIDVHRDQMKDAVRDAEAEMKKKYAGLLEYVKFLNKTFGIELEKSKWSEQWSAKIKQGYGTRYLSQDQLLDLFKRALAEDYKHLSYLFERMRETAQNVINITGEIKDKE